MKQGPVALPVDDVACRRGLGRASLALRSILTTSSFRTTCVVSDLSLGGARVQTDEPLHPGESVLLKLGQYEAFGDVRWTRGKTSGIQFDKKLPKSVMMNVQGRGADALRLASAEAKIAARDWVVGEPVERSPRERVNEVIGYGPPRSAPATVTSVPYLNERSVVTLVRRRPGPGLRPLPLILCAVLIGALFGIASITLF